MLVRREAGTAHVRFIVAIQQPSHLPVEKMISLLGGYIWMWFSRYFSSFLLVFKGTQSIPKRSGLSRMRLTMRFSLSLGYPKKVAHGLRSLISICTVERSLTSTANTNEKGQSRDTAQASCNLYIQRTTTTIQFWNPILGPMSHQHRNHVATCPSRDLGIQDGGQDFVSSIRPFGFLLFCYLTSFSRERLKMDRS